MNLILLERDEVDGAGMACLTGRRARHVLEVLHGRQGQPLKIGILDGSRGIGTIEEKGRDRVVLRCRLDADAPPSPSVDLLLALPRPKVMKRLWAPLASMGIGKLYLTNAARVERNYFDTHWLEPGYYGPLLVEGLEQAADTRLPAVRIIKRLKPFLEDELDSTCAGSRRLIAHPGEGLPLNRVVMEPGRRTILAVGPEGGWTDFELKMFDCRGFTRVTLGQGTLRIDTACIALLGALKCLSAT